MYNEDSSLFYRYICIHGTCWLKNNPSCLSWFARNNKWKICCMYAIQLVWICQRGSRLKLRCHQPVSPDLQLVQTKSAVYTSSKIIRSIWRHLRRLQNLITSAWRNPGPGPTPHTHLTTNGRAPYRLAPSINQSGPPILEQPLLICSRLYRRPHITGLCQTGGFIYSIEVIMDHVGLWHRSRPQTSHKAPWASHDRRTDINGQ